MSISDPFSAATALQILFLGRKVAKTNFRIQKRLSPIFCRILPVFAIFLRYVAIFVFFVFFALFSRFFLLSSEAYSLSATRISGFSVYNVTSFSAASHLAADGAYNF